MKKIMTGLALVCSLVVLAACQNKDAEKKTASSNVTTLLSSSSSSTNAKALKVRQDFDKIKLGTSANNFTDGTKLAQLKTYFGEPSSHKQEKPESGDITLDVYQWTVEGVSVEVKLYKDSVLVRSIQGFSYGRQPSITQADYDKVKNGATYKDLVNKFGSPDSFSEAASSDKVELQAVWYSNVKSSSESRQGQMVLTFTNNKLSEKDQSGMAKK